MKHKLCCLFKEQLNLIQTCISMYLNLIGEPLLLMFQKVFKNTDPTKSIQHRVPTNLN